MRGNIQREKKSSSSGGIGRSALKNGSIETNSTEKRNPRKGKRGEVSDDESDEADLSGAKDNHETDQKSSVFGFEGSPRKAKKENDFAMDTEDDVLQTVKESMENLLSEKPTSRMNATQSLIESLRSSNGRIAGDYLANSYQTQIQTILSRLLLRQVGTPNDEGSGLLDLTALVAISFSGQSNDVFKKFQGPLKKLVEQPLVGAELQAHALFTLGFICFINRDDEQTELWDYVEDLLSTGPDSEADLPFVQAARTWVMLAILMDDEQILERAQEGVYEALSRILTDADDVESRVTAGEALAFLYEVAHRSSSDALPETVSALSPRLCVQPALAADTLQCLQAAAKESSKKVSKRDKKELHAAFRAVEAWVFEGKAPESAVQLHGATIECTSFSRTFVLEDLKRVLGSGFQSVLRNFDVVRDILEVEFLDEDVAPRQRVEKGSKADKRRHLDRKLDRAYAGDGGGTYYEDVDGNDEY